MSLHYGLTDLRDNHLTCFTDMMYSFMVLGNLPSQLEILSRGQTLTGILRRTAGIISLLTHTCNSVALNIFLHPQLTLGHQSSCH